MSSKWSTAFHEAGHAVVAWHFECPLGKVSIVPTVDALGHVTHPAPLMIAGGSSRDMRRAAREAILVAFAGIEAQRLAEPDSVEPHHHDADHEVAFSLSREYGVLPRGSSYVGDDLHVAYLERLRREARTLVRRLWGSIKVVAAALIEREQLTGTEVVALLAQPASRERGPE